MSLLALRVDLDLVDHLAKVFEAGLDRDDFLCDCVVLGAGTFLAILLFAIY